MQILSIGFSIITILQFKQFDQSKDYLNRDIIESTIELRSTISNSIIMDIEESKYFLKMEDLLDCHNQLKLIQLYLIDSKIFYEFFLECIAFNIQLSLSEFINTNKIIKLRKQISKDSFSLLSKICSDVSLSIQSSYFKKLSTLYLDSIAQLKNTDKEGIVQDQSQFLKKLEDIEFIYKDIRNENCSYILNTQLKSLCNFDFHSKELLNKNNKVLISTDNQPQFNKTSFFRITNQIKKEKKYNPTVDKILGRYYWASIDDKNTTLVNCMQIQSIKYVYNLIENKMGVVHTLKSGNDFNAKLKKIDNQIVRYAPDKLIETTINKVSRKQKLQKVENIPYFKYLVKDFKRLSLIFKKQSDIITQINELKMIFGDNFEKECEFDEQIIKTVELKNGFNQERTDTSSYVDIKIIFEAQNIRNDVDFYFEVQINLDLLINFKKADHLIQDQRRSEENIQSMDQKIDIQNSNYSTIKLLFRQILQVISLSLIFYVLFITRLDYNSNIEEINCRKGQNSCQNQCINKIDLSNDCQQYIRNYANKISKSQQFQFSSKQYRYNTESIKIARKLYSDLNLRITKSYQNFCLQKFPLKIKQCQDKQTESNFENIEVNKIKYDGLNYGYLDKNLNFDFQDFRTKQSQDIVNLEEIVKNNKVIDFDFNEFYYCVLLESKTIVCRDDTKLVTYVNPDNNDTVCFILSNNTNFCGSNIQPMQFILNDQTKQNVLKTFLSTQTLCVIKINNMIYCQYFNDQQINDINAPEILEKDKVEQFQMSDSHICAIFTNKTFVCWGPNNFQGEQDISSDQSVFYQDVSQFTTCIINNEQIVYCQGYIQFYFGQNNIDARIMAVSDNGEQIIVNQMNDDVQIFHNNDLFIFRDYPDKYKLGNVQMMSLKAESGFYCFRSEIGGLECEVIYQIRDVQVPNYQRGSIFFTTSRSTICSINQDYECGCWLSNNLQISTLQLLEVRMDNCISIKLNLTDIQQNCNGEFGIIEINQSFRNLDYFDKNLNQIDVSIIVKVMILKDRLIYQQNKNNSIVKQFDHDIIDYGFGEQQICIQLNNFNLICQDKDFIQIILDKRLIDNVQKVGFNVFGFCAFNFQMEILCQHNFNNQILFQEYEYDIDILLE